MREAPPCTVPGCQETIRHEHRLKRYAIEADVTCNDQQIA